MKGESIINVPPYKVHHFSTVTTTMDVAKSYLSHGSVIWADVQIKGRGRFQRQWISPPGNLYLTVVIDGQKYLGPYSLLSFIGVLALYDTLIPYVMTQELFTIKWPNDLLWTHQKLSGILVEKKRRFFSSRGGN